jgi:penicillin amidase
MTTIHFHKAGQFRNKRFWLPFGILILILLFQSSCTSMAGRYILYRLSPDEVETEGRIAVELPSGVSLEGQVEIYLDAYSVPHIRADNEHDLYFALGYMQSRDRRFQLEMFKLLSHGRLRELIGDRDPTGVLKRTELMSRALGFYRDGEIMWERASSRDRELLTSFAEGINAAAEVEPVPMEFRILGYTPEPWDPQDTLVVIAMNAFGLCKNWEIELARLELALHQLRTGGTIEGAFEIFPPYFEWPPYLYEKPVRKPEGESERGAGNPFPGIPAIAPELAAYLTDFAERHPLEEGALQRARLSADGRTEEAKGLEQEAPLINRDGRSAESPSGPVLSMSIVRAFESFLYGEAASNNWSVDGTWTGTGKAALASDPHMPHMLPSLGYLFHLELAGKPEPYRVIGGSFLGFPGIAFGTNGSVAWGVTSNWADVTDLYVEKPVPGRHGFYYAGDEELPFEERVEVFKIRREDGGFDMEERVIRSTIHGVIINDFVERLGDDFPLAALKRNRDFGAPVSALLNLYGTGTVYEAADAIEKAYVFTGHWALADEEGRVGYVGSVNLPERSSHLGTFPSPGWTGEYGWGKRIPASALPRIIGPEDGIIATANQQVYPPFQFSFPVNLEGGAPFRYRRITELLREGGSGSDGSVQAEGHAGPSGAGGGKTRQFSPVARYLSSVQTDGVFLGWETVRSLFTKALVPLLDSTDPVTAEAAAVLLRWNGACEAAAEDPNKTAPALYNSLVAFAFRNTMADELSEKSLDFYLFHYNITPFLYNLLLNPNNPAWDDRRTEKRETYNEGLRQAFHDAVNALREAYGDEPESWSWDKTAPFVLKHPFGEVGALAGYLNRGPLGTEGMSGTVYAHQYERKELFAFPIKGGPILRVAVDLNDLPGSVMTLPGGMSGRPASRHYDDMLPLFLQGSGVSMEMDFGRIRRRAAGEILFVQADRD